MNIAEMSLAKVTVPNTWKVWTVKEDRLECIAIFNESSHAEEFRTLYQDLLAIEPALVTRHFTVSMDIEDD